MHDIRLEQKIIIISVDTIVNLFEQENGSDLVSLYMFYHKQCKLQKTNQSWSTANFVMKGLGWGRDRFHRSNKQLKELGFIEDIKSRSDDGLITGSFIRLNYIESSTLRISHSVDSPELGFQPTNAGSNKYINAGSTKTLNPENSETSRIEEKPKKRRVKNEGSSSIRERTLQEPYVPPEKEKFFEILGKTKGSSKFHEFFSIGKIYQSFTEEQIKETYDWMIEFFQEKYEGKIYRDDNTNKMIGSDIILDELDKMIAYYSSKGRDILDLKATMRTWIVKSSKPYSFTAK